MNIGNLLKRVMKKKGISLYRVAKDLGIAEESLRRSLQEGANPEWKTVKLVLDYLESEVVIKSKRKEVRKSTPESSTAKMRKGGKYDDTKVR